MKHFLHLLVNLESFLKIKTKLKTFFCVWLKRYCLKFPQWDEPSFRQHLTAHELQSTQGLVWMSHGVFKTVFCRWLDGFVNFRIQVYTYTHVHTYVHTHTIIFSHFQTPNTYPDFTLPKALDTLAPPGKVPPWRWPRPPQARQTRPNAALCARRAVTQSNLH